MAIEKRIKRMLSILGHGIVVVSMIWTFLSAITLIRARLRANARSESSIRAYTRDIALPRLDSDSVYSILLEKLIFLAARESEIDPDTKQQSSILIDSSLNLIEADSTFFYRLVYLSECSCPAAITDRYDIYVKYIDPQSLEVFREENHRKLSAEDAYKFNELIAIERR